MFITIGPYQATGSSSGLPDTSRKRMPSSPACTVDLVAAVEQHERAVVRLRAAASSSAQPTPSVGTASGADALQNFPAPVEDVREGVARRLDRQRLAACPAAPMTSR